MLLNYVLFIRRLFLWLISHGMHPPSKMGGGGGEVQILKKYVRGGSENFDFGRKSIFPGGGGGGVGS